MSNVDVVARFSMIGAPLVCPIGGPSTPRMARDVPGADCLGGFSDDAGAVVLATGGGSSIADARTTHYFLVDETSGTQVASVTFGGSEGMSALLAEQPTGFIVVIFVPSGPAHLGALRVDGTGKIAAETPTMQGTPLVAEVPGGGILLAGDFNAENFELDVTPLRREACLFNADLTIRWCSDLRPSGPVVGAGFADGGRALVLTRGGAGELVGQWFDSDGIVLTPSFVVLPDVAAANDVTFDTAPLIGGCLAIRRVQPSRDDPSGRIFSTSQWIGSISSGAMSVADAPDWLKARPDTNMKIAFSGQAYAMLPLGRPAAPCSQAIEIVSKDGTSLGACSLRSDPGTCRTEDIHVARDGTPIQLLPRGTVSGGCGYRFWPRALR